MIPLDPQVSRARRALVLKVAAGLVVVAAIGLFLLRDADPRDLLREGLDFIRGFGPAAFFLAMAILPALGCPVSVFTLSAGPIFGAQLGLPLVLALSAASLAVNLAFSYWIARYALRPWVEWLFTWLGYPLPQAAAEDRLSLAVLVRVTPGPPYFLQSFVLGLAGIPFGLYMAVSWLISTPYAFAFILFGDSLAQGRGKVALLAVSLFIALTVGIQFVRRHFARLRQVRENSAQPRMDANSRE